MSEDATPYGEQRIFFQHLRRPLLTEDGRALVEYLEQRFCERRQLMSEVSASGVSYQYIGRMNNVVPGDPYATHELEGCRKVVLFLKDLQEMEG